MTMAAHRGHIFSIQGDREIADAADGLVEFPDGGLLVDAEGIIRWSGHWEDRPDRDVEVVDHRGSFILPGFVDTHMHFPQVYSAAAYGGGQLLEWLNACIFPAESRLVDPAFARTAASDWVDMLVRSGTTTSLVFGSAFPDAQDLLFAEYRRRGIRGVIGRGIQTVGPNSARHLITGESEAIALCRAEIEKWHPAPNEMDSALVYAAIVPRFALAVTPDTLRALGDLYDEYRGRGLYFTSHLNENNRPGDGEVAMVRKLYRTDSYLDTYDGKFLPGSKTGGSSLLGRRSVVAHGVWCNDAELARMAETGTSIAHCPNSQLFLGSGTMPWRRTLASGVNVAGGTDFGGGDSGFIPYVLNMAFKQHISDLDDSYSMHPAEMLHLGTLSGARALDLEGRIGNLDAGKEADFVVLDPSVGQSLERTMSNLVPRDDPATDRDSRLFTLLMQVGPVNVVRTYVRGQELERG